MQQNATEKLEQKLNKAEANLIAVKFQFDTVLSLLINKQLLSNQEVADYLAANLAAVGSFDEEPTSTALAIVRRAQSEFAEAHLSACDGDPT